MRMSRAWAMPHPDTFTIQPIHDLVSRWVPRNGITIDPFARNSEWGTITNDLDPSTFAGYHMPAIEFLDHLIVLKTQADCVILDPPYSPRQLAEAYKHAGMAVSTTETQNARLYRECKERLDVLLKPEGIALCFGWNSTGFGSDHHKGRHYEMQEILLVCCGGAHNDYICTVERKLPTLICGVVD